jgi:NADPH-dependent curcumin reductase CurA
MSDSSKSNQLVLAVRPERGPVTDKTFRRETAQLPELKEGQLRVRVDYVSIVSVAV